MNLNEMTSDEPLTPYWQEYVDSDPTVLAGKPIVKGTRLAVTFILRLLAAGWTEDQVLESYPVLTRDALHAVLAYAADATAQTRLLAASTTG